MANENEISQELEQGVREGHLEKDENGKYKFTQRGVRVVALTLLLDVFETNHEHAYTFGALVYLTQLDPNVVVEGLAELISENVVKFGIFGPYDYRIFYLCHHKKQLQMLAAPGEEMKAHDPFRKQVIRTLKRVRALDEVKEAKQ